MEQGAESKRERAKGIRKENEDKGKRKKVKGIEFTS
jgi:hypothetical protein